MLSSGTPLVDPEWQAEIAFHRHVLTGVPEDPEEAEGPEEPEEPVEPEDPDAPPAITKLPLYLVPLYLVYVNRCLEELELQLLAAATPAGTSLVAIQRHLAVTLATWDAVWGEYLRSNGGSKVVLQACRKVVERPNSGRQTDRVKGKVVTVDELRTCRVSSAMNTPQPCEEKLDHSDPTRPEGWKLQ
ncbi:hypothetical protein HaLaN_28412, partial [Haematococcus lacustris]